MTEQEAPQAQLVYNEQDYTAPLAEVAPDLDPATAGDAEIIEAVAYHWDILNCPNALIYIMRLAAEKD